MSGKPGKNRGRRAPRERTCTALNADVHIYEPCHNCAKAAEHEAWGYHERASMTDLGCIRLGKIPPLVTVNSINSDEFRRSGKVTRTAGYDPNAVGVGRRPRPRNLTRPRGGGAGRVTAAPKKCRAKTLSLSKRRRHPVFPGRVGARLCLWVRVQLEPSVPTAPRPRRHAGHPRRGFPVCPGRCGGGIDYGCRCNSEEEIQSGRMQNGLRHQAILVRVS